MPFETSPPRPGHLRLTCCYDAPTGVPVRGAFYGAAMREHVFNSAAWAPHLDYAAVETGDAERETEVDWLRRLDDLAVAWVLDRARIDGTHPVLRVPSDAGHYTNDHHPLSAFAKKATIVTNRGHSGVVRGATLVPHGYAKEIAGAMACADGSSILVTEHPMFPLHGWAMALGALNLRTMRKTPDTRTPEQRDLLQSLLSQLYGGWSHVSGKRAASHYLPVLADAGMTWATFVGSVLAANPSHCNTDAIAEHAPPQWREELTVRDRRIQHIH